MDRPLISISGSPTFNSSINIYPCGQSDSEYKEKPLSVISKFADEKAGLSLPKRLKFGFEQDIEETTIYTVPAAESSGSSPFMYNSLFSGDKQCYPVGGKKRGRVLLVNIDKFRESEPRLGSEKDLKTMRDLWKSMGCAVTVKENQSAGQLVECVKEFSQDEKEADYYVVTIMSHGHGDDLIVGTHQGLIEVKEIVDTIVNSDQMRGKPKLILFQMCRGDNIQTDADQDSGDSVSSDDDIIDEWVKKLFSLLDQVRLIGSGIFEADARAIDYLGTTPDALLAFATQPEHVAIRHRTEGSWFIQSINSVFSKYAKDHHVVQMMEMVKNVIEERRVHQPGTALHKAKVTVDVGHTFGNNDFYLFPQPRKNGKMRMPNFGTAGETNAKIPYSRAVPSFQKK